MALRLPTKPLKDVRLAAFDLDGTLLNENRILSDITLEALHSLSGRNIQGVIVTARSPMMAELFCYQAGLEDAPMISLNGALILFCNSGQVLLRYEIDSDLAAALIQYCHRNGFDYTFYTEKTAWLPVYTKRIWRMKQYDQLLQYTGFVPVRTRYYQGGDPSGITGEHLLKIIIEAPGSEQRRALEDMAASYPQLRMDCSEGTSITLSDRRASKANALGFLCDYLGYSPRQLCCFGDYYNDMEMFYFAHHSVAMGNAPKEVQSAARYVTYPNTEDGVARFINNYFEKIF